MTASPENWPDQAAIRQPNGRFRRGAPSPNPGGRPKQLGDVTALARTHSASAIAVLAEIMGDVTEPAMARVAAARTMLDRGWGRPPASLTLTSAAEDAERVRFEELFETLLREEARNILTGKNQFTRIERVGESKPADPSRCDPVDG